MSTWALVEGPKGVVAAWETEGQVWFGTVEPGTTRFGRPRAVPGPGRGRKHPAVAVNGRGELIVVWTEGTGWERGGALAWQVYDRDGKPTAEKGRLERGIPVWGLPTVVGTEKGFTIFH
jgi:hypothetical protein